MKKLKQMSGPYSIGFELSSTAHGFVATDPNGNVLYHGKQALAKINRANEVSGS